MMRTIICILFYAVVSILFSSSLNAADETYPSKSITVIVQSAPGGSTDLLARAVEKIWPKYSSQSLIIVNKYGSGGIAGAKYVVDSKPDGYTMLMGYGSGECIVPHIQKMPFDPFNDLIAVSRISIHPVIIVTSSKSKWNSLKDLIEWAKKENKPIIAAASMKNGTQDLTIQAIAKSTGVKIESIPFSGGTEPANALAGGHVMISAGHPSEIMPYIKSKHFKLLGVSSLHRNPLFPQIKTLKEQGIDIGIFSSIKGVAVPANTPKNIIRYIDNTFEKIAADTDFKQIMADLYQPVMYLDSVEFTKSLKKTYDDYGNLIKDLNLVSQ